MKRLQVTTVVTTSLGFLAVLLAASADQRAALLILAAAVSHVVEEILARRSVSDEFSNRLGSMGALVAFGIAPSMFVLDTLLAVNQALLILPLVYVLATAIWLTRYDITRRYYGLPAVANGFVIPGIFLANFFTAPIVVGWLILASALMAFELSLRGAKKGRNEYEVKAREPKRDAPSGFIPLSDL